MAWNNRLTHVTGGNNIREPFRGEPSGEEFFHIHDDHSVLVHQRAEEVCDVDVAEDIFQLRAHGDVGVLEQGADGHIRKQRAHFFGEVFYGGITQHVVVEDGAWLDLHKFPDGERVDGIVEGAYRHLSLQQGDEDGGALFLDGVRHRSVRESVKLDAPVVRCGVADVADDGVKAVEPLVLGVVFVKGDPLAADLHPLAALVFHVDGVALAVGVDGVTFLEILVDQCEIIEVEESAPVRFGPAVLGFSGEFDIIFFVGTCRIGCLGETAFARVGVERIFSVFDHFGGGGVEAVRIFEKELRAPMCGVACIIERISAERHGESAFCAFGDGALVLHIESALRLRVGHIAVYRRFDRARGGRVALNAGVGVFKRF